MRYWARPQAFAALTIAWLAPRGDPPPIDLPPWLHSPDPPRRDNVQIALSRNADVTAERPETESVVAAMLPPKAVADALQATKQPVVFSASMLISAGIAAEISEGMVRAAEDYARGYDVMVFVQLDNMQRRCGDYFMAIWPDLGDLIRTGRVTTEIRRLPEGPRGAPLYKTGSTFVDNPHKGELIFTFRADQWAVSVKFKEGPELPQPDLFARVRGALARDNSKVKDPR